MNTRVYPIPMGFDRGYVIQGQKAVMVDGGVPGKAGAFMEGIQKAGLKARDISLVILTHGHLDHIGSAKEIKEITGAQIAMHELERERLEKTQKPLPPGVTLWGKVLIKFMAVFAPFVHFSSTNVDIPLGNEAFPLGEFGIPGKIVYTPGHTRGSVSIVLKTGEAFVGDLAMNALPLRFSPGLPIFAEDLQRVKDSWKVLLGCGVKMIYPAHGKPFAVDRIREHL